MPIYPVRRGLVIGTMALATLALLGRAVELHVLDRDFLQGQGDARYLRSVDVAAHRGMITDRHGEPLAISTPVESVWANPAELMGARDRWGELAEALGISGKALDGIVAPRKEREFVYLRRHMRPDLAADVMALGIPGVSLQREYRRYYPTGEVSAHVVGFTDIDDRGLEGVERMYDDWLRGEPGSKRVIKDRLGRVVETVERVTEAKSGEDLRLSLDRRIQYLAFRELKAAVQRHKARSGSLVVLDARTGEILAMVNQPAYNPHNRGEFRGEHYRNRAVTDLFEPGSTIKAFTVAAALESGRYEPNTPVDTSPGWYRLAGNTIRDFRNYGVIDVADVIRKSSNVGASRIALSLEPQRLWDLLSRVGFGLPTGSGFPGEAGGNLHHFSEWGRTEQATVSYGYGLNVTALQLAQAYTAFAEGGRLKQPRFTAVKSDDDVMSLAALQPPVARDVRQMLESVVTAEGTGSRAMVPGYRIAGKTGTTRKAGAQGYSEERYTSVFAGLAPASRPRLVGVVVIDEPGAGEYYGGAVAAPVFATVMAGALRLMDIAPDGLPAAKTRLAHLEAGQ